jgi:dTDP-4-dehydrorhamnose reductase
MRILVTGSTGFLGSEVIAELVARGHDVVGAARHSDRERHLTVDLLQPLAAERLIQRVRPAAVVHLAAVADIAPCKADPEAAHRLNALVPGDVARACAALGLRLVHVSTDQVFDGSRGFWREGDATAPRHLYGRTKLAGERAVLAACPSAIVLRPALATGRAPPDRRSASSALLDGLQRGARPRMFTDEIRSPIAAADVARAAADLVTWGEGRGEAAGLARGGPPAGLLHCGGPEALSRYDLARREAAAAGLNPSHVTPATRADAGMAAERPADLSLDSTRLFTLLRWRPRTLEE